MASIVRYVRSHYNAAIHGHALARVVIDSDQFRHPMSSKMASLWDDKLTNEVLETFINLVNSNDRFILNESLIVHVDIVNGERLPKQSFESYVTLSL